MAASFSNATSKTRSVVFQKSSFLNKKSSHGKLIDSRYLTHCATIIIPYNSGKARLPSQICDLEKQQMSHIIHDVPLHLLVDKYFIEAFAKKGQLYMLSHKRHIDTQDCVTVTPTGNVILTGHLILHITKDTYEQLGLEGKPSAFSSRSPSKYVVDIDLKPNSFAPGRKGYDRVLWCLKDRLDLTFDLLLSWTPPDDVISPGSAAMFFARKGLVVSPVPLRVQTQWLSHAEVPILDSDVVDETEQCCGREALWEFLGAITCGIDMSENSPDSYVSTLSCPSPSSPCQRCCVLTVSGFLTPAATSWLLEQVRGEVETEKSSVRWASLTLHGFQDCPVSVASREHGFFKSGDNLHTFVCFNDKQYWSYSLYGQHDRCQ